MTNNFSNFSDYKKNLNSISDKEHISYKIVKDNKDMFTSKIDLVSYGINNLIHFLLLPLIPYVCYKFVSKSKKGKFSKFFKFILITPVAILTQLSHGLMGLISIPLAILAQGLPFLFSKKYRAKLKLVRDVKKLFNNLFYLESENNLKINKAYKFLNSKKFTKIINEIQTSNKILERNIDIIETVDINYLNQSNTFNNNEFNCNTHDYSKTNEVEHQNLNQ